MNTLSRTLRLFLDSIGRRSEYEFYLKKFQSDRSACFALVLPDSGSVESSGELMTFDLQFLLRLELCPLLLLCGADAEANARELQLHGPYHVIRELRADADPEEWRTCLQACLQREEIPVFCRPELDDTEAVKELAPRLVKRLHVLRTEGMLMDHQAEKVFYYYTRRPQAMVLNEQDQCVVNKAEQWLEHDPQLHISVSSPLYLLQEMFTVRGRGSIIRPGSQIDHLTDISEIDLERLLKLIQSAFGKTLKNPASLAEASDFYIESRYRGAAILEPHVAGKYLSKFTVGTEARGEGVAQELWEAACESQPKLFWRSKSDNPINQWYERHAAGHHTEGKWTVFWKGVSPAQLPEIIAYATGRPVDFVEAS
ncbi:hypothetical protein P3T73_00795 [Kiritimatiellota bacterium B12222]|nr:hypothetical protein P3T73_00795 [Kiritimatiellota bacterium B12222]